MRPKEAVTNLGTWLDSVLLSMNSHVNDTCCKAFHYVYYIHVQVRRIRQFLVCNHVTRRLCRGSMQKNFSMKNLHENRV